MITIEEIEKAVEAHMKSGILSVIDNDQESVQLWYIRPNDVLKFIEELGGTTEHNFETNGFSWDYDITMQLNREMYRLGGDGYYSHYAVFQKQR